MNRLVRDIFQPVPGSTLTVVCLQSLTHDGCKYGYYFSGSKVPLAVIYNSGDRDEVFRLEHGADVSEDRLESFIQSRAL